MKIKKKAAIAAAVFAVTMNLSACAYGPPEDYEGNDAEVSQTEYDPEENQNATVYGPPTENYEENETDISDTEYDPEENVAPAVYGPPADEQ